MERSDVVIVGGGPMGTAAARALSARGRAVVLLARFTLVNDRGSTAGTTRNFRLTYHDPLYVRMARRALDRWRELEDESGQELMRVVGGLDVGEATEASAQALEDAGVSPQDDAVKRAVVFLERTQMDDRINDQKYAKGSRQGGFVYATIEDAKTL